MQKSYLFTLFFVLIVTGCSYTSPEPIELVRSEQSVDFIADVKPIMDKRCVTCHSCYNSPCQAKLSSFDGIDRGGSKEKVYLAERLFPQEPTRLFIDAKTTQQWREKEFFSLTESTSEEGYHNSIMGHMLYDKNQNPQVVGEYAPEYDELICPKNLEEVSEYRDKHPNHGMPYGFPALNEKEYATIMQWLAQGAQGPSEAQQTKMQTPSSLAGIEIAKWEKFLNSDDAKHQMTARYLYEHYFLGEMHFTRSPDEFFTLIRSSTPPGEKPDEIATLRPYDDPKVEKFYYRFKKIYSTIVHKTHMVVELDDKRLEYIKRLFIDIPWDQEPHIISYKDAKFNANPFLVFAQIPTPSRYRFLLDHSEYIVRTFVRGPSCRGQIALNVIHDHFWVMFQDPEYDIGVIEPEFLLEQADNLRMPIETGSYERIYRVFSDHYRDLYEKYYYAKIKRIEAKFPQGFPFDAIWKGRQKSDAPLLSVYRHFDSASVHKGPVGKLPRTMWVMDYAQFERIYYSLVAGFDVFGNVSHQANVRRYMDFLRLEGETNFLRFMPKHKRTEMFSSWYMGDGIADDVQSGKLKGSNIGDLIIYKTDHSKQEFIERLIDTHFLKEIGLDFDSINYFRMEQAIPELPESYKTEADFLQAIRSLTAPGTGFIRHVVDNGINVIFVKITLKDGREMLHTLVVNRWHDNVNSMFGEAGRLDSSKDTLDIIKGSIGSYPNLFFVVSEEELPDFFDMLANFKESESYIEKVKKYAISRSDKAFWDYYDWFQKRFYDEEPLHSGLYDLNRYYKKSW